MLWKCLKWSDVIIYLPLTLSIPNQVDWWTKYTFQMFSEKPVRTKTLSYDLQPWSRSRQPSQPRSSPKHFAHSWDIRCFKNLPYLRTMSRQHKTSRVDPKIWTEEPELRHQDCHLVNEHFPIPTSDQPQPLTKCPRWKLCMPYINKPSDLWKVHTKKRKNWRSCHYPNLWKPRFVASWLAASSALYTSILLAKKARNWRKCKSTF